MLWPLVLPIKVTLLSLAALVALCTVFAPVFQWRRIKTFALMLLLACVAFVPSCTTIMAVIDSNRFGVFHYNSIADVNDFRVERYLPAKARSITVEKFAQGHRAKYTISESDLMEYIDGLWSKYGDRSALSRDELHGDPNMAMDQRSEFGDLGWAVIENAVVLHSPVESDYGGATYYFDQKTDTAYQRAGYW